MKIIMRQTILIVGIVLVAIIIAGGIWAYENMQTTATIPGNLPTNAPLINLSESGGLTGGFSYVLDGNSLLTFSGYGPMAAGKNANPKVLNSSDQQELLSILGKYSLASIPNRPFPYVVMDGGSESIEITLNNRVYKIDCTTGSPQDVCTHLIDDLENFFNTKLHLNGSASNRISSPVAPVENGTK